MGHPVKGWVLGIVIGFVPELGNIRWIKGLGRSIQKLGTVRKRGAILALNMLLSCLKSSLGFFHKILQENPYELLGQPSCHHLDKRARWEPELSLENQQGSLTGGWYLVIFVIIQIFFKFLFRGDYRLLSPCSITVLSPHLILTFCATVDVSQGNTQLAIGSCQGFFFSAPHPPHPRS